MKVQLIGTKKRTSNSYGRNLPYMSYRVLIDGKPIEDIYTKEQLKKLSYWSSRSETLAMTCWGTSQLFEAQLALGSFLGMKKEKGKEDWGTYTRRVTDTIKEI